ncbi:hypothetical protein AMTR_s00018p00119080 [Amborella trichopoda]|uniref:Uncharacterized protein n=1 Tax=Amborella trichopoda TaxID=13333 RepID=W1PJH5_AMBTC|nr:hypothetical protein AMTR_s00018p00119080 [Amborella trichopoda]
MFANSGDPGVTHGVIERLLGFGIPDAKSLYEEVAWFASLAKEALEIREQSSKEMREAKLNEEETVMRCA